jgi:small-conductance mechanosensitive channel
VLKELSFKMSTPIKEFPEPKLANHTTPSSEEDGTAVGDEAANGDSLTQRITSGSADYFEQGRAAASKTREKSHRLGDDLALLQAERIASHDAERRSEETGNNVHRSRTRAEPVDEFDAATNPIHERTQIYKPPEKPSNRFAQFFKWIHQSSFIVRWFTYIVPVVALLLIPLLLGARVFPNANVGGVKLVWFSIWLEIVWLTLWAGRIVAKCIPWPMGLIASLFTNNSKKWRDLGKQLEVPATLFFWWLGVEISFLPTMKNHTIDGNTETKPWETTVNKIIISTFVGFTLNFIEKIIIQLIAISFHLRTYADRIDINKFQIGSLTKLYQYSKQKIVVEDSEFEEDTHSPPASGARTPAIYAEKARKGAKEAFSKVGDVAGAVAGDFTGKEVVKSSHPHQVVLELLNTTGGGQVLARRLYRTFGREGFDTVFPGDLKIAFETEDEAEAAFSMFDKDMNGDISMEELEAVCVEIGRERKSITASLKDLDSVVSKLDDVFVFIVLVITLLVFLSLLSPSAGTVLTSAGSTLLALSWLFAATAQEFLQSVIFVFVKHPFDVGDRVSIYGNTGATLQGDDYFVKEIALLYTEFKKMEGHIVQAPNSYLNTLFILNMRRSGGLAEALPIVIRFGTTLEQIDALRQSLLEFVKAEKREYQGNILTELREVKEAYSLTLNIVFFYKSNWQNELLRLQRRNKFICALMVAMQEIGIEGPRRNIPGAKIDKPYYVHYPGGSSSDQFSNAEGDMGRSATSTSDRPAPFVAPSKTGSLHSKPSIIRTAPTADSRPRGESVSAMARRVDFSLGMQDVSSGDLMSDLYEDRSRSRILPGVRADRIDEEDEAGAARATGRANSSEGTRQMHDGLARRSTSMSSNVTHRNRFFDRLGRVGSRHIGPNHTAAEPDLMEQGRMDPRSGTSQNQAVQDDTRIRNTGIARSQTEDFEMRRMR